MEKKNNNYNRRRTDDPSRPRSPRPNTDEDKSHLNLTRSTRFKISIFSTIVLTITGIWAYIYNPENIDKFAFYTINMVLPIISYVVGRTIRSGRHKKGILSQSGTRYRTALISFIGSLIIGIVCYIFSPYNIDKLGMYMIGVVLPIVGIILGQSFRKSERRMYQHDYDGYGDYYGDGGNYGGGYDGGYGGYGGNHGGYGGHEHNHGNCGGGYDDYDHCNDDTGNDGSGYGTQSGDNYRSDGNYGGDKGLGDYDVK